MMITVRYRLATIGLLESGRNAKRWISRNNHSLCYSIEHIQFPLPQHSNRLVMYTHNVGILTICTMYIENKLRELTK